VEFAAIKTFVACEFVALRGPVSRMLAMIAIGLLIIFVVSNSRLQGFTGTIISLVTLYHIDTIGVVNIPVMSSNRSYFIFFLK
jgi:hypothetical protein